MSEEEKNQEEIQEQDEFSYRDTCIGVIFILQNVLESARTETERRALSFVIQILKREIYWLEIGVLTEETAVEGGIVEISNNDEIQVLYN